MGKFSFTLLHTDTRTNARLGTIRTPHGVIETPAFVPVGTQASVKSLTPDELRDLGVQLFFVNTYHAYLRPGLDVIKKFDGLHAFMGWNGPIITDSGGFQVFSLGGKKRINVALSEAAVLEPARFSQRAGKREDAKQGILPDDYKPVGELVKIDEDGVTFTSHWDGTTHRFTPERSLEIQHVLGADILIAFDECAPYPTTARYAREAMDRTHRWAKRSLAAHKALNASSDRYHALYGVVQGSVYEDLRVASAQTISAMDVDGIAIGGVSVGESKREMEHVLSWVTPHLPQTKPRHLLGVGEIDDIFTLVSYGIDTFDCVQPTRLARMGRVYVKEGSGADFLIDITNARYAGDTGPIALGCTCFSCRNFSRSYIHHLFRVRELLGYRLTTIHNLHFVNTLVAEIRQAIADNTFLDLKNAWLYNT